MSGKFFLTGGQKAFDCTTDLVKQNVFDYFQMKQPLNTQKLINSYLPKLFLEESHARCQAKNVLKVRQNQN